MNPFSLNAQNPINTQLQLGERGRRDNGNRLNGLNLHATNFTLHTSAVQSAVRLKVPSASALQLSVRSVTSCSNSENDHVNPANE